MKIRSIMCQEHIIIFKLKSRCRLLNNVMKIHKILIRFWESINLVSITFLIILGLACSGTLYNKVFDIQLVKCHDCRWLWSMNVGWVCLKQHFMIFWIYCDWHFDGFLSEAFFCLLSWCKKILKMKIELFWMTFI